MKKLFVSIFFLAALGGVLYMALHMPRQEITVPANVQETGTTTSAPTETQTIKEETASYLIDVDYRLFGIPSVDTQVEAAIHQAIDSFKKDAANFDPAVETRPYAFTGDIADYFSGGDIVSERINLYQDTGGAHGQPIVLTLNYDAKTGQAITLDRALALTGLSLTDVAAKSLAQLKQEFGESVFVGGADPKPENYATFMVEPYSVKFIFQAYQVVAYAAGMPEVKFNRTDQ